MTKSMREILVDLYNAESGTEMNEKQSVDQALKDIADWLESHKKQGITFKGKYSLEPYSPKDKIKVAINACIDELKGELK